MTWQLIETSPRDGTEVILFAKGRRPWVGFFIDSEDFQYGKSVRRRQEWTGTALSFSSFDPPQPTHWMPLPEVPE